MKSRRIIALFMCIILSLSLVFTGCSKEKDSDKKDDTKNEQVSPEPTPDEGDDKDKEDDKDDDDKDDDKDVVENVFDYEKGQSVLSLEDEDEFDSFLNEVYLFLNTTDSLTLHFAMQNPEDYGIEMELTYGDSDTDTFEEDFIELLEDGLADFDYDELSESQQIVYDLLSYELDMYYQGQDFENFYIWSLAQSGNVISNLQSMFTEYSIQTKEDAETYIELLKMYPDYLEDVIDVIQEDVDAGACLTQDMYDMSIDMAKDWLSDEAEENVIYIAFRANLQEAELDEDEEDELLSQLADVIDETMMPAMEDYIDYIESLEDEIDEPKGLASFDGGKEYYDWLLESYLGTGISTEQLYEYLVDEHDAMWDRILEISEENPTALYFFMSAKSKYSDDPEEILEALEELAKEYFPDLGDLDWVISYLQKEQEVDSIAAYYLSPQLDNIGRRIIRVNGSNVTDSIYLFVTLAHEGIPGHLYQDEYSLNSDDYQEINSSLSYLGYQEGWAMYVEKLATDWCIEDDDYAELWFINTMSSYVMVSIADIGVNYMGWSYDDLCDWMEENGYGTDMVDYIYGLVVSDPGLYPAYGMGYLLMNDTVSALVEQGDSLMEAHTKILEIGCAPYSILWDRLGVEPLAEYAK